VLTATVNGVIININKYYFLQMTNNNPLQKEIKRYFLKKAVEK